MKKIRTMIIVAVVLFIGLSLYLISHPKFKVPNNIESVVVYKGNSKNYREVHLKQFVDALNGIDASYHKRDEETKGLKTYYQFVVEKGKDAYIELVLLDECFILYDDVYYEIDEASYHALEKLCQ